MIAAPLAGSILGLVVMGGVAWLLAIPEARQVADRLLRRESRPAP